MPILHWSPRSPFVRKAMVAIHEKGLADQIEIRRTPVDPLIPLEPFMALNPLSKIPTLEREDAPPIFDSRVIMEWADTVGTAGPKLFPDDPEQRWRVLSLEAMGDGLLDHALPWLVETRMRPEEYRYDKQIDVYRRKLYSLSDWLEPRIDEIASGGFNAGQIALAVAYSYMDFRFAGENWRKGRPALTAWHEQVSQRASMQATAFRDDPRPDA
ncbi:glutathione S-transferase family protein [Paracoccus aerodenitrificans]|uniref:glutathione S-transferase family protein n=1 Tax=Paracoccus aerodenitrificans TaxID=3017781 RepID=UPI0022F0C9B3|nr:glutathione S-transferase family protein [Paracoccus aerodenitrificans]WBU63531.1 glutathione S-transferase family protein [Paracoccus aerodenitrificans]